MHKNYAQVLNEHDASGANVEPELSDRSGDFRRERNTHTRTSSPLASNGELTTQGAELKMETGTEPASPLDVGSRPGDNLPTGKVASASFSCRKQTPKHDALGQLHGRAGSRHSGSARGLTGQLTELGDGSVPSQVAVLLTGWTRQRRASRPTG